MNPDGLRSTPPLDEEELFYYAKEIQLAKEELKFQLQLKAEYLHDKERLEVIDSKISFLEYRANETFESWKMRCENYDRRMKYAN